jgi:hypothetical protein
VTDDLVKRLRKYCDGNNDLMDAAADRIEQLEAALQNIVIHCKSDSPPNAEALKLFARAALGEKKDAD